MFIFWHIKNSLLNLFKPLSVIYNPAGKKANKKRRPEPSHITLQYTEKVSYSLLPGGKEMKKEYIKEIVRRLKLLDLEAVELVFRFVKNLKK